MEEKNKRVAIVVDTNFIVELKDNFQKTVEKLSEKCDVFVTEISVNERISQKYIEIEKIFQEIDDAQKKFKGYATIKVPKPFDEKFKLIKTITEKAYKDFFEERLIPFISDKEVMDQVLERAYKKVPPFATAQGSSDKGFKDTLLWLSMINFFSKNLIYEEIVFITNDKGFTNNEEALSKEFLCETGKKIEIKTNDYYKTILGEDIEKTQLVQSIPRVLSDKEKHNIRKEISEVFKDICYTDIDGSYDDQVYSVQNFIITQKIDVNGVAACFQNLKKLLEEHVFNEYLNPSDLFFVCIPNIEDKYGISIESVEKLNDLYQTILTQYDEYINQFFNTACDKINEHYSQQAPNKDDDLPF